MDQYGKILRTLSGFLAVMGIAGAFADDRKAPETAAGSDAGYRLAAQDAVQILVFQEEDLSGMHRVSEQGKVCLPLAGEVAVAGLTCQEAARSIENALRPDYLLHPHVTVTVSDFSKRRITVLGEVNKPGAY
jgi:protein involved in polysaccharide export with SLBB domain